MSEIVDFIELLFEKIYTTGGLLLCALVIIILIRRTVNKKD